MDMFHFEVKPYQHRRLLWLVPAVILFLGGLDSIIVEKSIVTGVLLTIVGVLGILLVLYMLYAPFIISVNGENIRCRSRGKEIYQFNVGDISALFFYKEVKSPNYEVTFRVKNENYGCNSRLNNFNMMATYIIYCYEHHLLRSDDVIQQDSLKELYTFKEKYLDKNKQVSW